MVEQALKLSLVPTRYAICRLPADTFVPAWATRGAFFSITRTAHELSVVCAEGSVPEGTRCEPGWRALRVAGVVDLSMVGVLARLAVPLAEAGVSLFAVSTFDTDYVLVKESDLDRAIEGLTRKGITVVNTEFLSK
jgi:hypothetical protein